MPPGNKIQVMPPAMSDAAQVALREPPKSWVRMGRDGGRCAKKDRKWVKLSLTHSPQGPLNRPGIETQRFLIRCQQTESGF